MKSIGLVIGFMSQFAASDAPWGAILGTRYFLILFRFSFSIYVLYVFVYAGLSGILLGAIAGFVTGIITRILYYLPANERQYRRMLIVVAALTTLVSGFLLFYFVLSRLAVAPNERNALLIACPAAIVATVVSVYASRDAAKWYLSRLPQQRLLRSTEKR